MAEWKVVGEGVFGKKQNEQNAVSRLLSLGDQDATYDMLSQANASDANVAAARESFMRNVENQRAEEERRAQAEAAAQLQAAMSGYGGGTPQTTGTSDGQPKTSTSSVDTSEYDKRIRQIQQMMREEQKTGRKGPEDLAAMLAQAQSERDAAISAGVVEQYKAAQQAQAKTALDRKAEQIGLFDLQEADEQTLQEGRQLLAQQKEEGRRAADPVGTAYNDLYAAMGENNQAAVEDAQRRITQLTNPTKPVTLDDLYAERDRLEESVFENAQKIKSGLYSPVELDAIADETKAMNQSLDKVKARIKEKEIDEQTAAAEIAFQAEMQADLQSYQNFSQRLNGDMSDEALEAEIRVLDMALDFAEKKRKEIARNDIDTYGEIQRGGYYDTWVSYEAKLEEIRETASRYLQMSDEEKQHYANLEKARQEVERKETLTQEYARRAEEAEPAYKEAQKDTARKRLEAEAYAWKNKQAEAAVANYNAAVDAGADQETLQALYDKASQLVLESNAAYEKLYLPYEEAVSAERQAAQEYGRNVAYYNIYSQKLEDSVGAYYKAYDDILADKADTNKEYRDAYRSVLNYNALIEGYGNTLNAMYLEQQELFLSGQSGSARAQQVYEQIVEYEEQIAIWEARRSEAYAFAYQYDYTRTLSELDEADHELFRKAVRSGQNDETLIDRFGEKEYERILEMVRRETNAEAAQAMREDLQKLSRRYGQLQTDAMLSGISVMTNIASAPGAIYEVIKQGMKYNGTGVPLDTNAPGFYAQNLTREIRGTVGQHIADSAAAKWVNRVTGSSAGSDAAKMLYSTLMSGIDSAAAMLVGNVIGAGLAAGTGALSTVGYVMSEQTVHAVGGYLLGATAASNAMQDIAERGGSYTQIVAGGLAAGAFECLFEKWSIEKFYALQPGDAKDLLKNIGKSMLTNASEEANTELANILYDYLAMGNASEWQNRKDELKRQGLTESQANKAIFAEMGIQIGESALSGAIMGAGFGLVGTDLAQYRQEKKLDNFMQALRDYNTRQEARRWIEISDRNESLLPQYRVELTYKQGETTAQDLDEMAWQVNEAWAKQNADLKKAEAEHPQEAAEAKAEAAERKEVSVRSTANQDTVLEQANAGEAAARADAEAAGEKRHVQEDARIEQERVSRETTESTPQTETAQRGAEAQEEAEESDEEKWDRENARQIIAEEAEMFPDPEQLAYTIGFRIQEEEQKGNYGLAQALRKELTAWQQENAPSAGENAPEQNESTQTISEDLQGQVSGILDRLASENENETDYAQAVGDKVNELRIAGDNELADALEKTFAEELEESRQINKEAEENAGVYSDRDGRRSNGADSAGQSESVGKSAGAAQRAAENTRAGRTAGTDQRQVAADRVRKADEIVAPRKPMREIAATGDQTASVMDITDTEIVRNDPELRALVERAKRDGVNLRIVIGPLRFEGLNKPAKGWHKTETQQIVIRADHPTSTATQIYEHELFHDLRDDTPGLVTAVYEAVRDAYESLGYDMEDIWAVYEKRYAEAYDRTNEEAWADRIKEEICADAYSGMGSRTLQVPASVRDAAQTATEERTGVSAREARPEATQTQQETRKGEDESYSIESLGEAAGLTVKRENGRYVFYDENGRQITRMTANMITHSGIGVMIDYAAQDVPGRGAVITEREARIQKKAAADLMNLIMKAQDADLVWRFAGSALFSAVKTNSDAQYGTTIDFSTVCRKTQEMMTAMSTAMVRLGRGLTKAEVIELQKKILEEGGTVPCPVCYVFSRWAGVGGILDNMNKWQQKYGHEYDDQEKLNARIEELRAATANKKALRANLMANDSTYQTLKAEQESLQQEKRTQNALEKRLRKAGNTDGADEIRKQLKLIDARLDQLKRDISTIESNGAPELAWLERVRSKEDYWEKGNVPERTLFNLNDAAEFAESYPLAWGYRTSRGPSAGKAILPYSDMRLGDAILGPNNNSAKGNTTFANVRDEFTSDQRKALERAIKRTLAQNLIGGQRFQSTSDFRYDYALDYLQAFWEMQALGSNMQTYTKIVEFAELAATVGGDVNLSVMPLERGYDETGRLKFSSVTGMNIEAASKINAMFDNVQLILVGINDEHIRLALRDDAATGGNLIGFVIPYHASGASINTFIRGLVENLGESFNEDYYKDYSPIQNDSVRSDGETETRLRDIRKKLLTQGDLTQEDIDFIRGENADISDRNFEELREIEKRALRGDRAAIEEYKSWSAGVLWNIYQKMWVDENARDTYGVKLSSSQAAHIMPHEYWDKSVDRAHAYVNGFIFRSYCYSMGLAPRFTGIDSAGKSVGYGDFSDEPGYWKTLIDRPMYGNDGVYRDQQKLNVTDVTKEMLTPEYGERNWGGYKVAEPDDQIAERAAQRFIDESESYSIDDEAYMDAVENGDTYTADYIIKQKAVQWGAVLDEKKGNKRYQAPLDLFHGTPTFGFTTFDMNKNTDSKGMIYATTKREVAANYGGRGHYASARPIGKGFIPGATKTSDIIQNAKTVLQSDYHVVDEKERTSREQKIEKDMSELVDRINALYNLGVDGDSPIWQWDENLYNDGQSYLYNNIYSRITSFPATVSSRAYFDSDQGVLESLEWDLGDYEENLNKVRNYLQEHREEIKNMPGGKELLSLILGFDLFDAYVDVEYAYQKLLSGKELIANRATGLDYPSELQERLEEIHNVGAYHLYGNLGDNPLIIDAGGHDWLSVKTPETEALLGDDQYHMTDTIAKAAREAGYTAVVIKNVYDGGDMADNYIFFSADQVKSADTVTYDDDGNVILPSERFNSEEEDVRYSLEDDEDSADPAQLNEERRREIEAGDPADDNAAEPTFAQKVTAAAADVELDEISQKAYDDAMAKGDMKTADLIRKQRAAGKMARDLRREANREKALYNKDRNAQRLERIADLRKQANEYAKQEREYAKKTKIKTVPSPRQTIRRTADSLLNMWQVKPALRYQYREQLETVLDAIWRRGYVSNHDVEALFRAMFTDAVDWLSPNPAYEDIAKSLRGKKIYVPQSVRDAFGNGWEDFRKAMFGARMTATDNSADASITDIYEDLFEQYPGIFDSGIGNGEAAKLQLIYDAVRQGSLRETPLVDSYRMQGLDDEKVFKNLVMTAEGMLQEFAATADIESKLKTKSQRELTKMRENFIDQQKRQAARREQSELLRRIRSQLKLLQNRATHHDEAYARALSAQDEQTQNVMNTVLQNVTTVASKITGKKLNNLLELRAAYEALQKDNPNFVPDPKIEKLLERIGKVYLTDFSVDELQVIVQAIERISHQIKIENDMIDANWLETLSQAGEAMRAETKQARGRTKKIIGRNYSWNEDALSLSRGLKRLGGWNPNSQMWKIAEAFERGDMDAMNYIRGADAILEPFLARTNNDARRKWLYKSAHENAEFVTVTVPKILGWREGDQAVTADEPIELHLTQMQLVELALAMKNPDNLRHIKYGGLTVPNMEDYKKGDLKNAYVHGQTVKLGPDVVRRIVNENLSDFGKEFANLLDKYYNEFAKGRINAVSQRLEGVDRAINRNYYPIRTDTDYLEKTYNIFDGTIDGMGMMKERNHNATVPILLGDADQTYTWHRNMMSRYVGYAIPVRNYKALINYASSFSDREKNIGIIKDAFGAEAEKFLDDFMHVVETGELEDAKSPGKILGRYINQVLSANISSMMKQFAALALAGSTYGQGPVLRALGKSIAQVPGIRKLTGAGKIDTDLIRIYTPYLDMRNQALIYDQVSDVINDKAGSFWKIAGATAIGRNWMEYTDYAANKMLWNAAEYVVHQQNPNLKPGTEAEIRSGKDPYYKAVANVFNRMTFDTQTNTNMMSKPNILRRKDSSIRAVTMFRTDAYQTLGLIREAAGQMQWAKDNGTDADKAAAKRKFGHVISGVITSSLVSAAMAVAADIVRRRDKDLKDEDGNYDWRKIGKKLGYETLEQMASAVMMGSEIFSFIASQLIEGERWYDLQAAPLQAVNNLLNTLQTQGKKLFEGIKRAANGVMSGGEIIAAAAQIAKAIGAFFGIPVGNLEKNLLAMVGWISTTTAIEIQDLYTEYGKKDLKGLKGEELRATLNAYLTDEIGQVSEEAVDEYLRLYELFGANALPGANPPKQIKQKDEEGNEIVSDLTLRDIGTWDATYRENMIDLVNAIIGSDDFKNLTDDEKKKMLAKINAYASEAGDQAIGSDVSDWVEKVQAAEDAGVDLEDAISYYTRKEWIKSDKDENGKEIKGSAERKRMELLASMDLTDAQRGALLREFHDDGKEWNALEDALDNADLWTVAQIRGNNPNDAGQLQAIAASDLDEQAKVSAFEAILSDSGKDALARAQESEISIDRFAEVYALGDTDKVNTYLNMVDKGMNPDIAYKVLQMKADIKVENDGDEAKDMQVYRAIAESDLSTAEKWDTLDAMTKQDGPTAEKLHAARASGATIDQYLDLRENGDSTLNAYLDATRLGMSSEAAYKAVMAVKDLPELPEGQKYGTTDKQKAAVRACNTIEDQILAYAAFSDKDQEEGMIRKFNAAKDYGVTPIIYMDYLDVRVDFDEEGKGHGNYSQKEVVAALDSMDLTKEQKAVLWQMSGSNWSTKNNPYSSSVGSAFKDAQATASAEVTRSMPGAGEDEITVPVRSSGTTGQSEYTGGNRPVSREKNITGYYADVYRWKPGEYHEKNLTNHPDSKAYASTEKMDTPKQQELKSLDGTTNLTASQQEDYEGLKTAGVHFDGALRVARMMSMYGRDEIENKQYSAVIMLDNVTPSLTSEEGKYKIQNELAAIKYYSEHPDADYARYSAALDFGVTPGDAMQTRGYIQAEYDADAESLTQEQVKEYLDEMPYYTQEEKAALWQLINPEWSADDNPYAVYVGEQIEDAYIANL